MAKYEVLILGIKETILLKMHRKKIFSDSQLVLKQISDIYNTKDVKLQPYKEMVTNLFMYFDEYEIESIPRDNNRYVYTMTSVSSLDHINIEYEEIILTIKNLSRPSHSYVVTNFIEDHCFFTTCLDACEWYRDVFAYLKNGIVPIDFDNNARIRFKNIAKKYVIFMIFYIEDLLMVLLIDVWWDMK